MIRDDENPAERTMRVRLSDLTAPATPKDWHPFVFQGLEKVSRAQARIVDRLQGLLAAPANPGSALRAVEAGLKQVLGIPFGLSVEFVHAVRPRELRRYVADPAFIAALSVLPHKPRGLLEVEVDLAHAMVNALIGAEDPIAQRPLTDVEEGVIAFVVIEALRALSPALEPSMPRLRLEAVVRSVDQMLLRLSDETHVAVAQLRCSLGGHSGTVRVYLPASVLDLVKAREVVGFSGENLTRLQGLRTDLRFEIGRVEIGSDELTGLRAGDVILTESLSVRSDRGEAGVAQLRVGTGRSGWIDARVALEGDRYQASLGEFRFGESFTRTETDCGELPMEQTSRDAAEVLTDIPLQIAVELARVPTTADRVVSLKTGQIVELNRGPGDPVELSVNGRLIARGELVEVEGQLGVRILSLT